MNTQKIEPIIAQSIKHFAEYNDLSGKVVLLRLDLNTPLGDNHIVDEEENWRIIKALETIQWLQERGARTLAISHIGCDPQESLKPIFDYLSQHTNIGFMPDFDTEKVEHTVEHMQQGSTILFENIRSFSEEKNNEISFLEPLIRVSDLYVNEAFSVSHRKHASVYAIVNYLPAYFGLQFTREVEELYKATSQAGTTTLILGGAKFGTKLTLIESLLPHVSYVLMGGALSNVFLRERGFEIGDSYVDDVDITSIYDHQKILLPVDVIDQDGDIILIDQMNEHDVNLDIGPETETLFEQVIASSDTIIWNGPMGKYEDGYTAGSYAVAESVAHSKAYSLTGGGDTATVLRTQGLEEKFDFVSTGGGAMINLLAHGTLPGIEVILNQKDSKLAEKD